MKFLYLLLFFLLAQLIYADNSNKEYALSNQQEKRYNSLIDEIRCPICQGQSIGGSNSELAKDLRNKVIELIIKGNSDDQIRQFMIDRYGDFVSFKPPVNKITYLLWFAPFIFLIFAITLFVRSVKKSKFLNKL
jgi:cytochrome c-type biogenesis protein CcmH